MRMARLVPSALGDDLHEALLHALIATGFRFPKKGVLLSLGPVTEKYWFADEARVIADELKLPIFATPGPAETLHKLGIACTTLSNCPNNPTPSPSAIAVTAAGKLHPV